MKERCEAVRYEAALARMAGETAHADRLDQDVRSMKFSIEQSELAAEARSWR